jgi:hypothetical protein
MTSGAATASANGPTTIQVHGGVTKDSFSLRSVIKLSRQRSDQTPNEPRIMPGSGGNAFCANVTHRIRAAALRTGSSLTLKEAVDARTWLFPHDELAFEQGFDIRLAVNRVRSVLEQHQGCEFTGLSIFVSYAIG